MIIAIDTLSRDVTLVGSALGTVVAIGIIFGWLFKRFMTEITDRLGTPNGHGDMSTMLAKMLDGQTGQDMRIAQLEHGQSGQGERVGALEQDIVKVNGVIAANMARIEGFAQGVSSASKEHVS